MSSKKIKYLMESYDFVNIEGLEFARELNDSEQKIVFRESTLDGEIYVEAFFKVKIDGETYEFGGPVCAGAVDYLQDSFDLSAWTEFESILTSVVLNWFEAMYVTQSTSHLDCELTKFSGSKIELVKDGEDLVTLIPHANKLLRKQGFTNHCNGNILRFSRKNEDVFHIIDLHVVSNGVHVVPHAFAWIPDIQIFDDAGPESQPVDFESLMNINGGFLVQGGSLEAKPAGALNVAFMDSREITDIELVNRIENSFGLFFSKLKRKKNLLDDCLPEYRRSTYFAHLFVD